MTNTLTCAVTSLASGGSKTFTITVNPQSAGSVTTSVSVIADEYDSHDDNNQAVLQMLVVDPNADTDGDGVLDAADNCRLTANANQTDTDTDSKGNACDTDDDNDGVLDTADAFPDNASESRDTDQDGLGNNADTDDDDDGMLDSEELAAGRNPLVNEAAVLLILESVMDE